MSASLPQPGELWTDGGEQDVWKIVAVEPFCHMIRIQKMSHMDHGIARFESPFYTPLDLFLRDAKPIDRSRTG